MISEAVKRHDGAGEEGEDVLDVDVGVLSSRGVSVLQFECRPRGDVLSRANPVGVSVGCWPGLLLEELDDVVLPALALAALLSLSALA
eukprot:3421328-Pyramimonas_sp.AAC.1